MKKCFYIWALSKYRGQETPKGDFAYDLSEDTNISEEDKYNDNRLFDYLNWRIYDYEVKKIYKELVKEYKKVGD